MADTEIQDDLSLEEKKALLLLARESILHRLSRSADLPIDEQTLSPQLKKKSGAFISLHIDGELRGCIGSIYDQDPLYETVAKISVEAASRDDRFPALVATELPHTEIEISILSPLEPIAAKDVTVGTHGLLIAVGSRRGVLLPQVPVQYGWDRDTFLKELCRKAGADEDAWKDGKSRLFAFTAQVFSDESVDAEDEFTS